MPISDHPLLAEGFKIVAYRGGAAERPENTLEAFQHAASVSEEVVLELDIRRTADGVLVAFHDESTQPTTGTPGNISQLSYATLRGLDAGFSFESAGEFPYRGRGVSVPEVSEVLSSFPRHQFVLDIHSTHSNIASEVVALVKRHAAARRVVIASENSSVIRASRSQQPDWLFSGTSSELLTRVLLERIHLDALAPSTGGVLMIPEIHGRLPVLTPRFVRRARARGERIWVWVVDEVAEMHRLRALGAHGVFTPRPREFFAACAMRASQAPRPSRVAVS